MKFLNKIILKALFAGVLCVSSLGFVQAQSRKSAPSAEAVQTAQSDLAKATAEYKASLNALFTVYQTSADQMDAKAQQLKGLFDEGLISRKELEDFQTKVAEAKAKVDGTKKQIAAADLAVLQAQNPASVLTMPAGGKSKTNWSTGNAGIDALIRQNAAKFGVDAYLIYCVMEQESHFHPTAISPKGALGLMQLMPDTAARFGVVSTLDPAQNIMGGTKYLKQLLLMFNGRVDLVLASYNAGEGAVIKYGGKVPPFKETQAYVRAIGTKYGLTAK